MAALKEWAIVCQALADGKQTILLRKGGIMEYREGFTLKHDTFYLFPTYEHQNKDSIKQNYIDKLNQMLQSNTSDNAEYVDISLFAKVDFISEIKDDSVLDALEKYHIWNKHYIDIRKNYNPSKPLSLILLRIYKMANPLRVKNERSWAGCKSWIPLDIKSHEDNFIPVYDDQTFDQTKSEILEAVR